MLPRGQQVNFLPSTHTERIWGEGYKASQKPSAAAATTTESTRPKFRNLLTRICRDGDVNALASSRRSGS